MKPKNKKVINLTKKTPIIKGEDFLLSMAYNKEIAKKWIIEGRKLAKEKNIDFQDLVIDYIFEESQIIFKQHSIDFPLLEDYDVFEVRILRDMLLFQLEEKENLTLSEFYDNTLNLLSGTLKEVKESKTDEDYILLISELLEKIKLRAKEYLKKEVKNIKKYISLLNNLVDTLKKEVDEL
jgi:hypothetical protein